MQVCQSGSWTADGFGSNQSWQDYSSVRSYGVTYTNSTGRALQFVVGGSTSGYTSGGGIGAYVNGRQFPYVWAYSGAVGAQSGVITVPPGHTYSAYTVGNISSIYWLELR